MWPRIAQVSHLNGLVDQVQSLLIGADVWGKATLISHIAGILHTHGFLSWKSSTSQDLPP